MNQVTFTHYKSPDPLSKRYWPENDIIQKQAAAQMYRGTAERVTMPFADFTQALNDATDKQAFGYGVFSLSYPDKVKIVVSGKEQPDQNIISRSKDYFKYAQAPGVLMLDHDPSEYGQVMTADALIKALTAIHPAIGQAARIVRGSVSAGVHKTGEAPRTDKGFHIYIPVLNASDIHRYGAVLSARLWLAGFGFIALAKNGAMLDRTVIDGAVFSPERLDFVGKPVISGSGLEYTQPKASYSEGGALDTESLPDLTDDETAQVTQLKADAKTAMKPAAAAKQTEWAADKVKAMVSTGVPIEKAQAAIKQILKGDCKDLYDGFILEFSTGAVVSVAEVLANHNAYDGQALADPVEGIEYGRTTAKFYWNKGDKPFINSQAHGGHKYFLHTANDAHSDSNTIDWETPGEIETKTPPVQALHPELIPEPFRAWLADVSHRMQTPGDFAAISSIVIVGSLIGAGCSIKPKRRDDWEVIPNIWGAAIGRPSVVLKSPSMKEPMQLLERLQAEYGELFEQDKKGFEFDNEVNQSVKKSLKTELDKATKKSVIEPMEIERLRASFMELDEAPEATRRLFKTNETSIQSMTVLQTQNPRGILVFRDELTGLLVKWDREDGADERAYFLEGWNGDGSYTDVKIGRGLTDAKNICISLLGGIQPDKLKRYLYQAMQGNNDGLMQRLQLAVWPDEPESWQLIDTSPNKAEKQRAYDIVKALAELDFIQYGAVKGEYDERPYFRFDDAGQAVFNAWLTELQTIKIQQEENPLMVEHFGKFRSLMPSLALIFHCIDIADGKALGNVSSKAAKLAVEWCGYLESHARRIYAMAESPEHEAAVRLAEKIKAGAVLNPFTAHDVYHKGWHGLKDRKEVEAACNVLIEENWLMMQRKPKPETGRPPAPEYHINPKIFENH